MKKIKTTMHVLYPNGQVMTGVYEDMPEFPGLDATRALVEPHLEFQALVNERFETIKPSMEYVSVFYLNQPCSMFVDDEGTIRGLPINARASAIYWTNILQQSSRADPVTMNAIYGTAVLFDRVIWD